MLIQDEERRWRWDSGTMEDEWHLATPSLNPQLRLSVDAGQAMLEFSSDDPLEAPVPLTIETKGVTVLATNLPTIQPNIKTALRALLQDVAIEVVDNITTDLGFQINLGLPVTVMNHEALEAQGVAYEGGNLCIQISPAFTPATFGMVDGAVVLRGSVRIESSQLNPSDSSSCYLSREHYEAPPVSLFMHPPMADVVPFIEPGAYHGEEVNLRRHCIEDGAWTVEDACDQLVVRPLSFEGDANGDVRLRTSHESRREWAAWPLVEVEYSRDAFSELEQDGKLVVEHEPPVQAHVVNGEVHGTEVPRFGHTIERMDNSQKLEWRFTDIGQTGLQYTPISFHQVEDEVLLNVHVQSTLPWSIEAGWDSPLEVEMNELLWNDLDRDQHNVEQPPNEVSIVLDRMFRTHNLPLVCHTISPTAPFLWTQEDARDNLVVAFQQLRVTDAQVEAVVHLQTACDWAHWPENVEEILDTPQLSEFQQEFTPTIVTQGFHADVEYDGERPVRILTLREDDGITTIEHLGIGDELTSFQYEIQMDFFEVHITTTEKIRNDIPHLLEEDLEWNVIDERTEKIHLDDSILLAELVGFVFSPHEGGTDKRLFQHVKNILEGMGVTDTGEVTDFVFVMPDHFGFEFPLSFPQQRDASQPVVPVKKIHMLDSSEFAAISSEDGQKVFPLFCPNRASPQEGDSLNRVLVKPGGNPVDRPYGSYTPPIVLNLTDIEIYHPEHQGLKAYGNVRYIEYNRRWYVAHWNGFKDQWLSYLGFDRESIRTVHEGGPWRYGSLITPEDEEPLEPEDEEPLEPENKPQYSVPSIQDVLHITEQEEPEREQVTTPAVDPSDAETTCLDVEELVGLVPLPKRVMVMNQITVQEKIREIAEALTPRGEGRYTFHITALATYFDKKPKDRTMRQAVRHQAAIKYASPWVTVTIQQSQAGSTALNDQSHPRVEEAQSQDDEEAEVRIVHAAAYDSTEPNKPAPPAEPSPDEDQPQHQQSRTPTDTELEIRKRWLEKIREEWWDVDAEKHLRRVIRRHPNYPNQMKLENWYPENVLSEHDVEKINAALQHLRDIVQSKNQSPEESRPSLEYLSDLLEEVLANQARRE